MLIKISLSKVIKDKQDLEDRFEKVATEVKTHSEAKNIVLSRKLSQLNDVLENKVPTYARNLRI